MQVYSGLVILKNGDIKETNIKSTEIDELYKKCNFRKSEGFDQQCEWNVKINKISHNIRVYGRKTGKSFTSFLCLPLIITGESRRF